jgi:6-phosphofructokinase 2
MFVVASGSLPPGVPPDIYARLARIVKNKGAKLIVDTSGEALSRAGAEGLYLMKPNLGELAFLAGKDTITTGEAPSIARSLVDEGKSEVVVVSMGAAGALLVTKELSEIIVPPPVQKRSTVGAGDSMLAGIVCYLSMGRSLREAARFGVACGTAATLNEGTQLCHRDDADQIYAALQRQGGSG